MGGGIAMAPSRGILFAVTAFFLSLLLLFTLTYGRSHSGLQAGFRFPAQGSQEGNDYSAEDFAIALHRDKHALRQPRLVSHNWEITKGYRYPDGVKKLVYLINGMFVTRDPYYPTVA